MDDRDIDIYIGRQPIFDRQLDVYAYELLFRSGRRNIADVVDGDEATSLVIVNTFMEIGLNNIVGDRLAFINLTRAFVTDRYAVSLPKDRVVLEVLEDIEPDSEVVAGVRNLAAQGYRIALDDFIYNEALKPLVELADIIKIDVMELDAQEIHAHVEQLRRYPVRLLAEKVETRRDFDYCVELGFDYFQGYYFSQPKIIRGQRLPNNRIAILRLLARLQDPDLGPQEVEELISRDVGFSYRILKYVNSAAFALPRKVESIREAVVYVGLQTVRHMAMLLAMSQLDDKPAEIVNTALVRGRMAELLAIRLGQPQPESFFTVGLFSILDVLMDNSMEEILTQLPLADHIAAALLEHAGIHGRILDCVLAYERGEWEKISCNTLTMKDIRGCYLEALAWSSQIQRELLN
ncbi:MAG TPA: HDOD domain-containing protein [Gammaproteobacteria bacterium]|nr:HDOD domain-containing protein [Gammaproteobacteria bacterium]